MFDSFRKTPLGHAIEHAITAAIASGIGLLAVTYHSTGTVTLDDAKGIMVITISGLLFGVRTALNNRLKPTDDPTKLG